MNTKSVLIAALIAAATSSAFAADYVATAGNPELQIAQVTTRGNAASAPVAKSAVTPVSAASRKDDSFALPTIQADGRTRAEARAQAAAYNMSAEARAARFLYAGGQQ
jgi:hypothetical protein